MWVVKREIALIILFAPVLVACLTQKAGVPTRKAESTQDISTTSSTPLQTPTFLPTSYTIKLTLYPAQTATIEAAQTLQVMEDNCKGNTPSYYYLYGDASLFVSPNGDWQIAYCVDTETGFPYTRLLKNQDKKIWDIPFRQSIIPDDHERKDGALTAKKWSEDGKFVYLDSYFCCLDGPGLMFVNSYGLYRVELETAEIKEMLPESTYFEFSPDGAYLAGNNDSRNTVLIYDLKNDKTLAIPVVQEYSRIGMFSWSPGSQKIVFVGAFPDWENTSPDFKQGGFSLLLLDVKTKTITPLIENDIRFLQPLLYEENAWVNNDEILLSARDGSTYALNISTEEIVLQPTPTLNP